MATLISRIIRPVLFGTMLAIICSTNMGCEFFAESTFSLASESRLPKWITLPPGVARADVSLTWSYYPPLWVTDTQFILRDTNKHTIEKENGKERCLRPFQLQNPPKGFPPGYPKYDAVTVKGVTEIFEQRKLEPFLYVTDDPAVWKQYQSAGCG
jgi:hypothetical protein